MDSRIQKLVQTNILFTGSSLCQLFFVNSVIFIGVFQHSSLYSSAVGRRSSRSDSCLGLYMQVCVRYQPLLRFTA